MTEQMLTWDTVQKNAKEALNGKCQVCPVCNGRACAGRTPGPGGKGSGKTFMRNYDYLHEHIRIHMDVLTGPLNPDTSLTLFGRNLSLPVLAAPIGMVSLNLSERLNEYTYAKAVLEGMVMAGSLGITGGGPFDDCFFGPIKAIEEMNGAGIPNLKPWCQDLIFERMAIAEKTGAPAFVIDIDSAGLPHANLARDTIEYKSQEDLAEVVRRSKICFVVKGIMTPQAA